LTLPKPASGFGFCAAGDYDNDGFPDLALAGGNRVILLRNEHNGTFKDVSTAAGIKHASRAASGLMWIDHDHDGGLAVYVTADNPTDTAPGSYRLLYGKSQRRRNVPHRPQSALSR